MEKELLSNYRLGKIELPNRIVMAPLTRRRATNDNVPVEIMARYYEQRSTAGLIISEAVNISPEAVGYPNSPGIFTEYQVEKWKPVTRAVHDRGGRIFLQLWHVGRLSHSTQQPGGQKPPAPSPVAVEGMVKTPTGEAPAETPREMSEGEIRKTVDDYGRATKNARKAGFDGVEIHGANGYLPHQFLMDGSNLRNDRYGGSFENRSRFLFEVIEEVVGAWDADHVGLRLSPSFIRHSMHDSNPVALFEYVIDAINAFNLAYLHVTEPQFRARGSEKLIREVARHFRKFYRGTLMTCGGFDFEKGNKIIRDGYADLVAFGRPFISNPDLVERFRQGLHIAQWDESTFYTQGEKGYTDYPAITETK